MTPNRSLWAILGAATILAAPALSAADIDIHRDTIVPVRFNEDLTIRDNRPGDHFTADVDDNPDLPPGTRLEGRVVNMKPPRGDRPATMDLEFTDVILPGGERARIEAVPLPMDNEYVYRRGGRFYAKSDIHQRRADVLGGFLGGLIVGKIFHRPITGAILGTVVGAIAADNQAAHDTNVVVYRGEKLGALFNRDLYIEEDDPADRPARDDHYDRDDYGRRGDSDDRPPVDNRARDDRDIDVVYEDHDVRYTDREHPYWDGDEVMVPLQRTADQLKLDVDRTNAQAIYIEGDDFSLRLEQDSRNFRLNGHHGTLSKAVVEKDGVLYVPVEVFATFRHERLTVNGNKIDGLSN